LPFPLSRFLSSSPGLLATPPAPSLRRENKCRTSRIAVLCGRREGGTEGGRKEGVGGGCAAAAVACLLENVDDGDEALEAKTRPTRS
jgi:hypothetical protein